MLDSKTKQFLESLCFMIRGTAGDELQGRPLQAMAIIAKRIDARVKAKSFPAMSHDEFHGLCAAFARKPDDCHTTQHATSTSAGVATRSADILSIQRNLHKINADVPVTGKLDAVTVAAVNSVFNGWDDAPPKLRTGTLSASDIASQARIVNKFLKKAIGESQSIDA